MRGRDFPMVLLFLLDCYLYDLEKFGWTNTMLAMQDPAKPGAVVLLSSCR
jgi:hypothetical protein